MQSSHTYHWYDHGGVGGVEWQGRKILSRWLTLDLHSGQTSRCVAHSEQHMTCPHGTNAMSTSASVQIWHSSESSSLLFTTESPASYKHVAHMTPTRLTSYTSDILAHRKVMFPRHKLSSSSLYLPKVNSVTKKTSELDSRARQHGSKNKCYTDSCPWRKD